MYKKGSTAPLFIETKNKTIYLIIKICVSFTVDFRSMLKNFLNITFAFLFLGSSLHTNHFEPSRSSSGYSFCKSGCTNKNCLSFSHECQECLTENNRFFILCSSNHLKKISESSVLFTEFTFIGTFLLTNLSERSPPQVS